MAAADGPHAFSGIASFYDALYGDKDYEAECDFIEHQFARYGTESIRDILDIGCGTGGHLLPLARRGYRVTGIDCSPEMLAAAEQKANQEGLAIDVQVSDVRELQLGRTFDAAISMFAVISYLTTADDLLTAFRAVREHLVPGGLFLFDVWFGPGVLTERPTERSKVVRRGNERIVRLAHPTLDLMAQVVAVDYTVLHLRDDLLISETDEQHRMRFFAPQEIRCLVEASGFRFLEIAPFMKPGETPTVRDWNVSIVAQKE
jgi:SAM-dependent methyltransferase